MNIRALRLVSFVPANPAHSSRMSAGVVSQWDSGEPSGPKDAQPQAELAGVVSIGFNQPTGNAVSSVHPRSSGLQGYRSLVETGRRLGGLSGPEVREWIEHGTLIGREIDGELLVHDEDLVAFLASRRPHLVPPRPHRPTEVAINLGIAAELKRLREAGCPEVTE